MALLRICTNLRSLRCLRHDLTRTLSTTTPLLSTGNADTSTGKKPNSKAETSAKDKSKRLDDIEYVVNFKTFDVKKIFKQFYSVYGPLFVVCHIGVSLVSLGFFCSLSWLVVDTSKLIPDFMADYVSKYIMETTETGGKFIIAYAIHKLILPIRLGTAVWTTRSIANRVDFFKKRIAKAKAG